jgi:hypothetical protein
MEASTVKLSHHIEEEWICIVVQSLVVQKEFCQQTKILSVRLVFAAVYLKKRDGALSVDLIARRMS